MGSAWEQLEQMLTCCICLDKFKNPRLLPCQHSFCGGACMDGLVDYARRQIKCPECRAEHRIPYQGVENLPLNVTLIRFLELHARITGEEPEPVPTFMEKCGICGEKVEGVQRCAHCIKKVCPDCKEAHIDLLRREIGRINVQSRRSLDKLHEFRDETLKEAEERLLVNHATVRHEIEDSCKRLISDLQAKQRRLLQEVDLYVEKEQKTISKLKKAVVDEIDVLESNLRLADEKFVGGNKLQWTDAELVECKEIYNRAMEFVRLFDPEIGDFTRKVRFSLVPEFDTLRRRLCELGELKFSETAQLLIANSFQFSNATGAVATELCQAAAVASNILAQQHQEQQQQQQMGAYGLSHSDSNSNLPSSYGTGQMTLELPNGLMRSQSDHRLASQFQARMKQQEAAMAASMSRYGRQPASSNYDSEPAQRSRYAPQRPGGANGTSGPKDTHSSDLLVCDWPRPSDSADSDSTVHYKSAFMRRKERQHVSYAGLMTDADDDDELISESSHGRNVQDGQLIAGQQQQQLKVFDCREVVHAPFSGVPKLDECPQLNTRLHQLTVKALVDKKHAEEEGQHDKDLIESAWLAMSKVSQRIGRQTSEDEIEKQKQANLVAQQAEEQRTVASVTTASVTPATLTSGSNPAPVGRKPSVTRQTLIDSVAQSATATAMAAEQVPASIGQSLRTSALPAIRPYAESSLVPGGRRNLYGQAVAASSAESIRRQALRPKERSILKQSSGQSSMDAGEGSGDQRNRFKLDGTNSSSATNRSVESSDFSLGSIGNNGSTRHESESSRVNHKVDSPLHQASWRPSIGSMLTSQSTSERQTTPTTSDDDEENETNNRSERYTGGGVQDSGTKRAAKQLYQPGGSSIARYGASRVSHAENRLDARSSLAVDDDVDDDDDDDDQNGNKDNDSGDSKRNRDKRRSREFLPSSMNKLLDRSALIRRNNQEQRTQSDSPQRSGTTSGQSSYSSGAHLLSRSGGGYSSLVGASNSSSSGNGGSSAAIRQRLAYQRSLHLADDDAAKAAAAAPKDSGQSTYLSRGRRFPSNEESESISTNTTASDRHSLSRSTGRTGIPVASTAAQSPSPTSASRFSSSRHDLEDNSNDGGGGGYQSRFLSRSRTSAALSAGNDSARSHEYGQDSSSSNRRRWHIGKG